MDPERGEWGKTQRKDGEHFPYLQLPKENLPLEKGRGILYGAAFLVPSQWVVAVIRADDVGMSNAVYCTWFLWFFYIDEKMFLNVVFMYWSILYLINGLRFTMFSTTDATLLMEYSRKKNNFENLSNKAYSSSKDSSSHNKDFLKS